MVTEPVEMLICGDEGAILTSIEPGSPWENGYGDSFNGKLRNEILDREIFYTLKEAQIIIGRWRYHYNHKRPHSSLGYKPPVPAALEHRSNFITAGVA